MATLLSAFIAVLYVIPGTEMTLLWQEWIIVCAWASIGILFYVWSRVAYRDKFGIKKK